MYATVDSFGPLPCWRAKGCSGWGSAGGRACPSASSCSERPRLQLGISLGGSWWDSALQLGSRLEGSWQGPVGMDGLGVGQRGPCCQSVQL